MSTWLNAWRKRGEREPPGPVMELLVVAGVDAGSQFTLEGDEVLVGRGEPASGETHVVRLEDKSISRKQAWIRRDARGTSIEHIVSAANPTYLNGEEISRATLRVGDRIEMGRVSIDVRARAGMNLSGLTEIMEVAARESAASQVPTDFGAEASGAATTAVEEGTVSTLGLGQEATDIRPMEIELGRLEIERGGETCEGSRFPIRLGTTRIGRGDDADVRIAELGVSRLHAEIEVVGRRIELVQRSRTNPTLLNGIPVLDRAELMNGDEIQLADRVALRVELATAERRFDPDSAITSDLSQRMQHKIELEREIEQYQVLGSFLDVDVVESRAMKGDGERAEHIIVSFERFRAYVSGICEEWRGQVLNSNGDELMCFFEEAAAALLAGSAILERLTEFNRDENLLGKPFRFRIGAHTGVSLVDLDAGIAYSEVLDTAGHIQKQAEPNSVLVSEQTLASVPTGLPVTPVGELTGGGSLYRIDRFLRPEDFGPGAIEASDTDAC